MINPFSAIFQWCIRRIPWSPLCMGIPALLFLTVPAGSLAKEVDQDVHVFFANLENAFVQRDFSGVVDNLHKDFTYIMTYVTDDKISFLESDVMGYRKNVGSFFLSKPDIYNYSITVEHIQRAGDNVMVLLRIHSAIELYGIVNTCVALSNYHLISTEGGLVVRDVRGDATCFNTKLN